MNEPKRLLAPDGDAATGFERQLLQAVLDERPSEAATQAMLEATLAAGSAAAPGAVGMGAGAWLASAAAAVGIAGLAAAVWLSSDASPEEVAQAPADTRSLGARPASASPASVTPEGPADGTLVGGTGKESPAANLDAGGVPLAPAATSGTSQDTNHEPADVRPSGSSPRGSTATTKASPARAPEAAAHAPTPMEQERLSRTLREEVELLDKARSALHASDASGALAALARYDERFPSGMLRKESAVLRQRATALGAPESPERR